MSGILRLRCWKSKESSQETALESSDNPFARGSFPSPLLGAQQEGSDEGYKDDPQADTDSPLREKSVRRGGLVWSVEV